MTTMDSMVLNAHVANETVKKINEVSGGDYPVENKHTREKARMEMYSLFIFGVVSGMTYLFTPSNDVIVDFVYIIFYLLFYLGVYSVSWDDKQPKGAIKASLIMSALLAVVMLLPFILDMDTQVHFKVCMVGSRFDNGPVHYIYREYTDYTNYFHIGVMVLICTIGVLRPIYKLRKSVE